MKFENTWVGNFEGAIRGLRNPLASWDKSDSFFGVVNFEQYESAITSMSKKWADKKICGYDDHSENISGEEMYDYHIETSCEHLKKNGILQGGGSEKNDFPFEVALIGPNDMKLAQKLITAGPEHRKFLRQVFVSVDITAPLYWWKEMDTYKVATVANSTSTMHKLASTEITLDCFDIDDFQSELEYYKGNTVGMFSDLIIEQLEFLRQKYNETKDKRYWKELVRWLPNGWLQTRTWTANYETIRAICSKGQRRNHKLTEWSVSFMEWAHSLPYAQYFIFDDENVEF